MKRRYELVCIALLVTSLPGFAQQEIGHFAPGVLAIRDFIMPEPGVYGAIYTYRYTTDKINDSEGNQIKSVTIGPNGGTTLDVSVDVSVGVIAPTFIWVSKWKLLGARYGAYISPSISNTSVGASLSIITGSGRKTKDAQVGFGDLFVQPIWLTWTKEHVDITAGYGFYAPVGKYDTETFSLPAIGSITAEASDNIGLGFWTHQFQGAASWYPWKDRRMSVAGALTYELHGNKNKFDLKPGNSLSFNWGISQYLPLKKDQSLLLEVGPAGYESWQVSDDSGDNAASPPTRDAVHAVGGQLGVTSVKWNMSLIFHYFYEYTAKDRFQGESIGINLALKF